MTRNLNIVLAGVGGQGTLVAGKILGNVARIMDLDVKVSEVHGMSQRGGSVITYVRMGEKVHSPIVEENSADFVLAFEQLESLRWLPLLKKEGKILLSTKMIMPVTVLSGDIEYPENIDEKILRTGVPKENLVIIPAYDIASDAGNVKAQNTVMIGAMSIYTGIGKEVWKDALDKTFPGKLRRINTDAFSGGREFSEKGFKI